MRNGFATLKPWFIISLQLTCEQHHPQVILQAFLLFNSSIFFPLSVQLLESFQQSFPALEFPPLPERGDFDLREVLESPYFFNWSKERVFFSSYALVMPCLHICCITIFASLPTTLLGMASWMRRIPKIPGGAFLHCSCKYPGRCASPMGSSLAVVQPLFLWWFFDSEPQTHLYSQQRSHAVVKKLLSAMLLCRYKWRTQTKAID